MLNHWEDEKKRQLAIYQQRLAALQEEEERKAKLLETMEEEGNTVTETDLSKARRESTATSYADYDRLSTANADTESVKSPKRRVSVLSDVALMRTLRGPEGADQDGGDPDQLRLWYKLDENSVPPVYRLQRIR